MGLASDLHIEHLSMLTGLLEFFLYAYADRDQSRQEKEEILVQPYFHRKDLYHSIPESKCNNVIETQYYKIIVQTRWCSHFLIQFKDKHLLFLLIGIDSTKILTQRHLCTRLTSTTNSNQTFPLITYLKLSIRPKNSQGQKYESGFTQRELRSRGVQLPGSDYISEEKLISDL